MVVLHSGVACWRQQLQSIAMPSLTGCGTVLSIRGCRVPERLLRPAPRRIVRKIPVAAQSANDLADSTRDEQNLQGFCAATGVGSFAPPAKIDASVWPAQRQVLSSPNPFR